MKLRLKPNYCHELIDETIIILCTPTKKEGENIHKKYTSINNILTQVHL